MPPLGCAFARRSEKAEGQKPGFVRRAVGRGRVAVVCAVESAYGGGGSSRDMEVTLGIAFAILEVDWASAGTSLAALL